MAGRAGISFGRTDQKLAVWENDEGPRPCDNRFQNLADKVRECNRKKEGERAVPAVRPRSQINQEHKPHAAAVAEPGKHRKEMVGKAVVKMILNIVNDSYIHRIPPKVYYTDYTIKPARREYT